MSKKVFVSQPMRGLSKDGIERQRHLALIQAENVLGNDYEIIDSYLGEDAANDNPIKCLAKSLELMADADIVVFAPGWEEANGCQIEHECAVRYGKERIELKRRSHN